MKRGLKLASTKWMMMSGFYERAIGRRCLFYLYLVVHLRFPSFQTLLSWSRLILNLQYLRIIAINLNCSRILQLPFHPISETSNLSAPYLIIVPRILLHGLNFYWSPYSFLNHNWFMLHTTRFCGTLNLSYRSTRFTS